MCVVHAYLWVETLSYEMQNGAIKEDCYEMEMCVVSFISVKLFAM